MRGHPRTQYKRAYLLLPQNSGQEWLQALLNSGQWTKHLWTVGYSADDAGIGDLQNRVVLAVNPETWGADLGAWYRQHYAGVRYLPISALSPNSLTAYLANTVEADINSLLNQDENTSFPDANLEDVLRGHPRIQYHRSYLLMPQTTRLAYIQSVINSGAMIRYRWTTGFSADDAGIGDLDSREIHAINPHEWGGDLRNWYSLNYPGAQYNPINVNTPGQLQENLELR